MEDKNSEEVMISFKESRKLLFCKDFRETAG